MDNEDYLLAGAGISRYSEDLEKGRTHPNHRLNLTAHPWSGFLGLERPLRVQFEIPYESSSTAEKEPTWSVILMQIIRPSLLKPDLFCK